MTSIDKPHQIDPKPFYRAVLTSHAQGGDALDEHPLEHRPGLVWNAAIKSISYWFNGRRPGRKPRDGLLALYAGEAADFETEFGFDPIPIIVLFLGVPFETARYAPLIAKLPMEVSGEVALAIPSVIGNHYAWRAGEREAAIATWCRFDHTLGRLPQDGQRTT